MTFNLIVDPSDIYRIVRKKGFNEIKPKVTKFTRISKPIQTERFQPKSIVLGSSRAEYGINMSDETWINQGMPALNNAVTGAGIYDISRLLDHALASAPIETVVIGLDFFMFNVFRRGYKSIQHEQILAVSPAGEYQPLHKIHQLIFTLLSDDFFQSSISTLKRQIESERKFTPEGQRINERDIYYKILPEGGFYPRFFIDQVNSETRWAYCRDNRYSYNGNGLNTIEIFDQILDKARTKEINLILFISPVHAWLLESMDAMGFWGKFENWKRDLVNKVEKYNSVALGKGSIVLWDFSDYSQYTTEPVPQKNDSKTIMKWYIDSSHYSDKLGHLMLKKMFDPNQNFKLGIKLTVDNIEKNLQRIRENRERFRQEHTTRIHWIRQKSNQLLKKQSQFGVNCS
jgi:hypothetical protein